MLDTKYENGVMTAYLSGEIDNHTAENLRNDLRAACRNKIVSKMVLDFSRVTFMDSSGIGFVLRRYKEMMN